MPAICCLVQHYGAEAASFSLSPLICFLAAFFFIFSPPTISYTRPFVSTTILLSNPRPTPHLYTLTPNNKPEDPDNCHKLRDLTSSAYHCEGREADESVCEARTGVRVSVWTCCRTGPCLPSFTVCHQSSHQPLLTGG